MVNDTCPNCNSQNWIFTCPECGDEGCSECILPGGNGTVCLNCKEEDE